MPTYKKNPLPGTEGAPEHLRAPKRRVGKRKPKKRPEKTKKQREAEIARENYIDRVKRMRGLFGEQFKAKDGYDLRKIDSWTPAQKAKVTRYFRVIAPRITGDFVVKRYRRKDNLEAAIDASLQEKRLPGQTAAAFTVDPGEKLTVSVKNGKAQTKRNGQETLRLFFDKNAFLEDPEKEIDRVLAATDANVFQIITGAYKQNKILTRNMVKREIANLINRYNEAEIDTDQGQRVFDEWLNGLVAYPGNLQKVKGKMEKFVDRHKKLSAKRERDRLDAIAARKQGISVSTLRRRRTIRNKRRGKNRGKK